MNSYSFSDEIAYLLLDNKLTKGYVNPVYITYFLTLLTAVTLVILGSYSTIEKPQNALEPNPNHPLFDQTDKDRKITPEDTSIDEKSALFMPVLAGLSLVGLYFGSKKFDAELISYYLNKYITFVSVSAGSFTISYLLKSSIRKISYQFGISSLKLNPRYALTFSKDSKIHSSGIEENFILPENNEKEKIIKEEKLLQSRSDISKKDQAFNYYFTISDLFGLLMAFAFTATFAFFGDSKNWILNNVLGTFLVIFGISSIRLPKFTPAVIMLVLFFVYDIYFVFGSEIMMKVATTIDIPCKILIPNKASREEAQVTLSLLGFGDIVLPGLSISLCLRYDLYKFHQKNPKTEFHHLQTFPKPYFTTAIISYTIALLITFAALHISEHGQPALLYITPSLLISLFTTAFIKKDFKTLFAYNEVSKVKKTELEINCSKETIFLATAEIPSEDEEDEEDDDFVLRDDDAVDEEEEEEEEYGDEDEDDDLDLSDEE